MVACKGTNENGTRSHCCSFSGVVCEHLRTDVPGRSIACGLLVELGTWDAVHADERYEPIRERCLSLSTAPALCGDWPPLGKRCNVCGVVGDVAVEVESRRG